MSSGLTFRRLRAEDLLQLTPQASQRVQYGQEVELSYDEAAAYAAGPHAWAAEGPLGAVACMGVAETFPGAAGLAWAIFAEGVELRQMARLTRFAREVVIGQNPLPRIEAVVRCTDVEAAVETGHAVSPAALRAYALETPTPQVRWALAVGLSPVAVLRKFGAANETHLLLERIL